ncbi:serine/threonine/tyrosine-interacting protein-like [Asterias rubens]|uniref:serine/threonine/tyrosine-interacting protein-like n=1 Tax=Asterias rubens TaxID=7604 RepID=UPI00145541CE|nr:serine/threonine/tyrosine-interacting protein-like [Asterias rubens]
MESYLDLKFPEIPMINAEETPDWVYSARREMQEIVPGLFLGPYAAAMKCKLQVLLDHGITHIVCIRQDIEAQFIKPNFPENFEYLVLNVADSTSENIIAHFPKVKEFIDKCSLFGGKTLVHGNAGMSRSAALVIAYIMETFGLSFKDAVRYVQQKRFCISPNEGFMRQLAEYEPIFTARLQIPLQDRPQTSGMKRTHEDVDCEMTEQR